MEPRQQKENAGGENTFVLTQTKNSDGEQDDYRKRIQEEYERNMILPREQTKNVIEVIAKMNDKIQALLSREKEEFMVAYRVHTQKVQQQLVTLRKRVADEQSTVQKDERVLQLNESREAHKREALRLDRETVALKKKLVEMNNVVEVLEDDRDFLLRQLQQTEKKSEVLRVALESKAHEDEVSDGESSEDLLAAMKAVEGMTLPKLVTRFSNPASVTDEIEPFKHSGSSSKMLMSLRRKLRKLKKSIASEKQVLDELNRQMASVKSQREENWLERHLVDCIRSVQNDVLSRRRQALAGSLASKPAHRPDTAANSRRDMTHSLEQIETLVRDPWGDRPLLLDVLTPSDRCQVLERFLADERVVAHISKQRMSTANSPVGTSE